MANLEVLAAIDAAGKVLQIVALVGAAGGLMFKIGRMSASVEASLKASKDTLDRHGEKIDRIEDKADKIGVVLTQLAVANERLDTLDKRYEEIRSVVFPFPPPVRSGG